MPCLNNSSRDFQRQLFALGFRPVLEVCYCDNCQNRNSQKEECGLAVEWSNNVRVNKKVFLVVQVAYGEISVPVVFDNRYTGC